MATYVLLFQCQDKKGIVAKISEFIFSNGGNIIDLQQHSTGIEQGLFFMRLEFTCSLGMPELEPKFSPVAGAFNATWRFFDRSRHLRMGILVSKPGHCLFELLYLWRSGELKVDIPFVLSNFPSHRELVEQFKVPFYFVGANKDERREGELLAVAKENSDLLCLARYMLVLSQGFIDSYGRDIINIHHGLLPSFKGARPYHQALERGVKVIGATAHFVSSSLDDGPIIAQEVEHVSHRDDVLLLQKKGRNLEKLALSKAVAAYIDYRVFRYANQCIVF